jgi:hypothetical protein
MLNTFARAGFIFEYHDNCELQQYLASFLQD